MVADAVLGHARRERVCRGTAQVRATSNAEAVKAITLP